MTWESFNVEFFITNEIYKYQQANIHAFICGSEKKMISNYDLLVVAEHNLGQF